MTGISESAFFDELEKMAAEARDPNSPWSPKTVGSPRSRLPSLQFPKAPTAPGSMSPKLVKPAGNIGPRQNYAQPVVDIPNGPLQTAEPPSI